MKITIERKNNKFYLEVERPHYPTNCGPSPSREVDKIYRNIERNIEKYHGKENDLNTQYINVKQMVLLLKNYFEVNPDVLKIKVQYKRTYPSKWYWIEEKDPTRKRRYSFKGELFTEDFIKEKIKVLKRKNHI